MITKQALSLLSALSLAASAYGGVEIGKPAPDFTATGIDGKTYNLNDYKGKIVVLESYNLDCPFCHNHFATGSMQELQKEVTSKGGIWLMVNSVNAAHASHRSTAAALKEWAAEKVNATAWLDDSSGKIGKTYGMKTTPHMFVIAPDGTLAYNGAIDDTATPDHDPRKARNYVREAVAKLTAGEKVAVTETKPYGCSVKYAE